VVLIKCNLRNIAVLSLITILFNYCSAQSVIVYPSPAQNFRKISDKYIVNIIQKGIKKRSFVYKSSAAGGSRREWGREQNNNFHFTTFSFSGRITIEVLKLNSPASSVTILPSRLQIPAIATVAENKNKKVIFNLNRPAKISVEFDDDPNYKDALMIFADKLENSVDIPDKNDSDIFYVTDSISLKKISPDKAIVYFAPGEYQIGYWNIPSHIKHIYITGGAYVKGYLNIETGNSIKINGRGILSNEGYAYHYPSLGPIREDSKYWYKMINIKQGQNIIIEGITLTEASANNIRVAGKDVLIKNVKIHGFRYNNDGISIHGSGNEISDCFIRVNDDAIVPYTSRLSVNKCVFWQLQGSIVQLGWTPHSMDSINIFNCDVIHDKATNSEGNVGFINAMNYTRSNEEATIKNVNVNNIYFDTPILRFLDIRSDRNFRLIDYASSVSLPWLYENFHFKNIYFSKKVNINPLIYLHGFSHDLPLSNFTFENIYINDTKISSEKMNDSSFINTKNTNEVQIR